jgi:hypothetical protein
MSMDSTDLSQRRSVSSAQTFLLKFIFPLFWISGFGSGTLGLWFGAFDGSHRTAPPEMKWVFLFAWIAGSTLIGWFAVRIKRVAMDRDNLYISNYFREFAVPYGQVMEVSENRWVSGHPVTLKLRTESEFGRAITFLPRARMFGFFSAHPIVGEIRALAGIAENPVSPSPEPSALVAGVPGFGKLRLVLARLNDVPARKLIIANVWIGLLAGASNGLAATFGRDIPGFSEEWKAAILYWVVPGSSIIALSGIVGLRCVPCRSRILGIHGIILLAGVCTLVYLVLGWVLHGIPKGSFRWTPGLLEASAGYATYLFCRFSLPEGARLEGGIYYLPVFAVALMIPLDIGVLARFFEMISNGFQQPSALAP